MVQKTKHNWHTPFFTESYINDKKNHDRCTAPDLEQDRHSLHRLTHSPHLATPRRHRLGSLWLVRRGWRARRAHRWPRRQHQTQLSRKPKTLLSIPPFPFLLLSVLLFYIPIPISTFHDSPVQLRQPTCILTARLRWPHILLHALPQPTARRAPLPPNPPLVRPTQNKTTQHPIVLANSYTTLVIHRDVPSITTGGTIARERLSDLLLAPITALP
jgi:hypothetical protein